MKPSNLPIGAIWEPYQGRLVSLWDMLILNSEKFLKLLRNFHHLSGIVIGVRSETKSKDITLVIDDGMRKDAEEIIGLLNELILPMSLVEAKRLKKFFKEKKVTLEDAESRLMTLSDRIHDEICLRTLFVLSDQEAKWYRTTEPFGAEVSAKFLDSREDLEEAAKCLALDRGTACVMHLMRAMEIALHTLATKLKAKFKASDDWDTILKEIDSIVNPWPTGTKAEISRKDQYREINSTLTSVKRAWRHPSAHARFNATPEIARDIFGAVKGFMVQMTEVM